MKKPRGMKKILQHKKEPATLEQKHDAITAQLNILYSEIDSSLPPELEALSDEILRENFAIE